MYCDDVRLIKLNNKKSRNNERDALFTTSHLTDECSSDSSSSSEYVPTTKTSYQQTPKASTGGNLIRAWERRGPVRLLKYPGDEAAGYLFFKNYKRLNYDELKQLISKSGSSFLSLKEQGDDYIKVRIKTEEDVRKLFFHLKQNKNYDVSVLLDMEDYRERRRKERNCNKIAKFKGSPKEAMKTNEDLLKDIAVANQLESDIRFDMNSRGRRKPSSKVVTEDNSSPDSGMIGTWRGHTVVMPATPAPRLNIKPTDVTNPKTRTRSKINYYSDNLGNSQKDCMLVNSSTDCLEPADVNTHRKKTKNNHKHINKNDGNYNEYDFKTIKAARGKKSSQPDVMSSESTGSNKKAHSIKSLPDSDDGGPEWETSSNSSNEEFLECYSRLRISACRKNKSQRHEETSTGHLPSFEYESTSSSDMSQLREEPVGPGLISIFDLYAFYMRKCVLNSLETSFEFVEK